MTRGRRLHSTLWEETAGGGWRCSCGTTGPAGTTPDEHRAAAAKAALGRLDTAGVYGPLIVTARDKAEQAAINLLWYDRHWGGSRVIRRFVTPGYDDWGCLTAWIRWGDLGQAVKAGAVTAPGEDLLVLRVALSLVGAGQVSLRELAGLEDDQRHTVGVAIAGLLDGGG